MRKKPCECCGEETTNPRFCNRSCSAKHVNRGRVRLGKNLCTQCATPIHSGRKYCGNCRGQQSSRTIEEMLYHSSYKSNAYSNIRQHARRAAKSIPNICLICGYNKHVEVCHKKGISEFPLNTPLLVVNALSNLRKLCPNCHWEYDKKLFCLI